MSERIHEIFDGLNKYLLPEMKKKSSNESSRIRIRKVLLATEKLCKEIRREVLKESKELKLNKNTEEE